MSCLVIHLLDREVVYDVRRYIFLLYCLVNMEALYMMKGTNQRKQEGYGFILAIIDDIMYIDNIRSSLPEHNIHSERADCMICCRHVYSKAKHRCSVYIYDFANKLYVEFKLSHNSCFKAYFPNIENFDLSDRIKHDDYKKIMRKHIESRNYIYSWHNIM